MDAELKSLFSLLVSEIKGMREDIKSLEKKLPVGIDPERLIASTSDANLPALRVVDPADPTRPNMVEPWPDPRIPKPPLVRG